MLSSFNALLIPILGGFLFVKYSRFTRYRALRDNGYVILFKSAVCGFFFYGISFLIWRTLTFYDLLNPEVLQFLREFLITIEIIPSIFSVVLIGISIAINSSIDVDMVKRRVILQDDDAFEVTILKAYDEEKYLQVTLDTRRLSD